jgi:hypothetical protein
MGIRTKLVAAAIPLAALLAGVVSAGPASASEVAFYPSSDNASANCASYFQGQYCLYYNSWGDGAVRAFSGNVPDFAGYTFWATSSSGSGQPVKNNAASAENATSNTVIIWYHSWYWGPNDNVPVAYTWVNPSTNREVLGVNLDSTYNNNASACFGSGNQNAGYCF